MTNNRFRESQFCKALYLSAAGLALIPFSAAEAQFVIDEAQPVADARADQDSRGSSDEIIVTAQRRSERLLDVPQSVSVLSTDDLSGRGITQLRDFANLVPGLNIRTSGAGDTILSIRGVTIGNADVSPTVGIYVDEVPYGASSSLSAGYRLALDAAPFDMERIEVLKGPQGTLYGASSMGGLLKYVTRRPDTNDFSAAAQAGISDTREGGVSYNLAAAVNIPIAANVAALRVSAFQSRDGGYIDNIATGEANVNRSDTYGARADLLLTPSERLGIRLTAYFQNIDREGTGTANYAADGSAPFGELVQQRIGNEEFQQEFRLFAGTVTYETDWATLTSITSYQTGRTRSEDDFTPLYAPLAELVFGRPFSAATIIGAGPVNKFVQELRIASPQNRPLEWVIGAFYNHERASIEQVLQLYDVAGNPTSDVLLAARIPSSFTEYAGFGTLTWNATSNLSLSAGIRYLHNGQTVEQIASGPFLGSRPPSRSSESVATYMANIRYQFSENANLYARYATGYRPGGPNFLVINPGTGSPVEPSSFDSDRLASYEIGFKGQTSNRALAVELSVYQLDWDNFIYVTTLQGIAFRINALGGARVRGAEAVVTLRPAAGLRVAGNATYLDSEILEDDAVLGATAGERLPGSARFSAVLEADYEVLLSRLRPTIGATVRYVGDRTTAFDATTATPQYRLPSYTTVDLRAGLSFGNWDMLVYIRNLLDKRGQLSAVTVNGLAPRPAIMQPRTIGLTASTRF